MDVRNDSYCGLNCRDCPIAKAMEADDMVFFDKKAVQWGTIPVNLMCTGCKTEMISASCVNCSKRHCVIEKELESCLVCAEYPCVYLG